MTKGIKIKLGGKKRHLLASAQAIAKYQEVTGRELAATSTIANFSLRDLVITVWTLLLHESPALTIDEVGDMIRPKENMYELMLKVAEAFDVYFKELEK